MKSHKKLPYTNTYTYDSTNILPLPEGVPVADGEPQPVLHGLPEDDLVGLWQHKARITPLSPGKQSVLLYAGSK